MERTDEHLGVKIVKRDISDVLSWGIPGNDRIQNMSRADVVAFIEGQSVIAREEELHDRAEKERHKHRRV